MSKKKIYIGTGRRKTSSAQVRMTVGKGNILINGQTMVDYLPFPALVMDLVQPLEITKMRDKVDLEITVKGGGYSGQTGAARLGITKALLQYDEELNPNKEESLRTLLKAAGFITRDARVKERKKYGLKKARRAPQYSKR